jgi:hypothetical protein
MKRIRIRTQRSRRERPWLDVLALDPRDPDIVRAKTIGRVRSAGGREEVTLALGDRIRALVSLDGTNRPTVKP